MARLVKKLSLMAALALIIAFMPALSVTAEEITLTTIMPSHDVLKVKKGVVGVNYKNTAANDITDSELYIEGNVGIGTTGPGSKLEVLSTSYPSGITVGNTAAVNAKELLIGYDEAGNYGSIIAVHQGIGYEPLVLQKDGGNIGIGTTNPQAKLHVEGGPIKIFGAWTNKDSSGNAIQGNLNASSGNQYQATSDGFLVVKLYDSQWARTHLFIKFAGQGSFIDLYDSNINSGGWSKHSATIPIGKDDIFYVNTGYPVGTWQIYWKPFGTAQLVKQ